MVPNNTPNCFGVLTKKGKENKVKEEGKAKKKKISVNVIYLLWINNVSY